ncbi:hypothetical protein CLOM_g3181 [Closterium sp. NIES-68]|nr:hypothetical protein CLOM_g3181 [Closterium sp. NIES-68]GJP64648.1 hypothetical protein CLOP_g21623 [Closterium sp. NIES-67]GJP71854.1 hypothetical protein CLOP_g2650 [Closterium sp. NIES-67]
MASPASKIVASITGAAAGLLASYGYQGTNQTKVSNCQAVATSADGNRSSAPQKPAAPIRCAIELDGLELFETLAR